MTLAKDIGLDLGTSTVQVYVKGKGIALDEPSVAALDKESGQVKKLGKEAYTMIGRTPPHIETVRPLDDGVISRYDMTLKLITWSLHRALGVITSRPRLVICVPSGITEVEERALMDAAMQAGASRVALVEEPVAAAIGAGLDIHAPKGVMVVDIGGGTTDIAVMSMGGLVASDSVKCGGNEFDESIMRHMHKKHNLLIGWRTAEEAKKNIGSLHVTDDSKAERTWEVRGRCIVEGVPKSVSVSEKEMKDAMEEPMARIAEAVCRVIEGVPTELLADITSSGICLTGGGALISGIDKRLSEITGLRCHVAEQAQHCVALGLGTLLSTPNALDFGGKYVAGGFNYKQQ